MSRISISLLASAALCSTPTLAAPKPQTLDLASSSQWVANYRDDACRLVRTFGQGDQMVIAMFSRYGPGDGFQFTLAGKPVKRFQNWKDVDLQFGVAEKTQKRAFFTGVLGESPALLFRGTMFIDGYDGPDPYDQVSGTPMPTPPPISAERIAAVKSLTVSRNKVPLLNLKLGSMAKPFAALDTCIDSLMQSWGLDPDKDKRLQKHPEALKSPGTWLRSQDYPIGMIYEGQSAIVQFRLMVDETGMPTSCHIQETTRAKAFDDAVCDGVMKRARFSPAIDAEGKPAASFYRNAVVFQTGF